MCVCIRVYLGVEAIAILAFLSLPLLLTHIHTHKHTHTQTTAPTPRASLGSNNGSYNTLTDKLADLEEAVEELRGKKEEKLKVLRGVRER